MGENEDGFPSISQNAVSKHSWSVWPSFIVCFVSRELGGFMKQVCSILYSLVFFFPENLVWLILKRKRTQSIEICFSLKCDFKTRVSSLPFKHRKPCSLKQAPSLQSLRPCHQSNSISPAPAPSWRVCSALLLLACQPSGCSTTWK